MYSTVFLRIINGDNLKWRKKNSDSAGIKIGELGEILHKTRRYLTAEAMKSFYHTLAYPETVYFVPDGQVLVPDG